MQQLLIDQVDITVLIVIYQKSWVKGQPTFALDFILNESVIPTEYFQGDILIGEQGLKNWLPGRPGQVYFHAGLVLIADHFPF